MLNVYWLCFVIGGAFVLLAILSGVDGADFGDYDAEINVDVDVEWADIGDRPLSSFMHPPALWHSMLDIIKSLKFWTFSLCFFGLTGLVLSHLSVPLPPPIITLISICMGVGCGAVVAGLLRTLRRQKSNSLVQTDDLIGLTGTVELPFDKHSRGKVRLQVKGSMIDAIAYTDDSKMFNVGDQVLVISMEQNRLWVVSADNGNEEN